MLDIKKVGIKICSYRKKIGYSQGKLAEILHISPQAVSKWENGRALPDTSLLPVLAGLFGCTIDDMLMPAYSSDGTIPGNIETQAEEIANIVVKRIAKTAVIGLDDDEIIDAVRKLHPNMSKFDIIRRSPEKTRRYSLIYITVKTPQNELNLVEKVYRNDEIELHRYSFLSQYIKEIPTIYYADSERKILLMEDLSGNYIQGNNFGSDTEYGDIIRENYSNLVKAAAKFHGGFWDNYDVFGKVGLDWRLNSKENLLAHISGMEKDFKKYKRSEETGQIAKEGIGTNNITSAQLDYYTQALEYLKTEYVKLIDSRFHAGKNITVIHGDLHPGNTFVSKSADRKVKFIDMQAIRMGLCTEDLAMLAALHMSENAETMPLLDHYYHRLTETVKDYSYETFIADYKISVAENMFFPIRLINRGITDFRMRDRAIKEFETFFIKTIDKS